MNKKRVTVPDIVARKNSGKKISAITAYDFSTAKLLDRTEIDIVLVGDSLGMVTLGYDTTLPVTMDDMIHHARAVRRGIHSALLVGDMPFLSYQASNEQAVLNAGRFIQEAGAEAIKLEGGLRMAERVHAVVQSGIPVMGHIGLTPQSYHQFGGYKVQGKNFLDARQIKQDARELQKAGVFSLVLEGIPSELAEEITEDVKVPTIGIGAGPGCDGQILVVNDLLGMDTDFSPKFVKKYSDLGSRIPAAIHEYIQEVRAGVFPAENHSYHLKRETLNPVEKEKIG